MSATGRNLEGNERHENDFYETPAWCTRAILPHLGQPKRVIDAGAGTGAILRECRSFWPSATCIGVESDEKLVSDLGIIHSDFLLASHEYDLVIANPPFRGAEAFLEHALKIGKTVAFLLRLNWLAADPKSKKAHIRLRAKLHKENPADIFAFEKRPSFTGGGTDATEYGWWVWGEYETTAPCWQCNGLGFIGDHRGALSCGCDHGKVATKAKRGNRWFILNA